MMQVQPKSHEQRIAELEAQVSQLMQVVGISMPLSGLGINPNQQAVGLAQPHQQVPNSLIHQFVPCKA